MTTDWLSTTLSEYRQAVKDGELNWQEEALCAQTDPEVFFPDKGGTPKDARKICGACAVSKQCLDYAITHNETDGVWGGLSPIERRRLRNTTMGYRGRGRPQKESNA